MTEEGAGLATSVFFFGQRSYAYGISYHNDHMVSIHNANNRVLIDGTDLLN